MRDIAQIILTKHVIMGFLEEKEIELLAETKREVNKKAAINSVYIEPKNEKQPEGYKYVLGLSVAFIFVGIFLMVCGIIMSATSHGSSVAYFIGGLLSSMICWAWAAVTRVCGLFLKAHRD